MKTTNGIISLLLLLTFSLGNLIAQPGEGKGDMKGHGNHMGNMNRIPGISSEQADKIKSFRISHQKEMLVLRNQMAELKAKEQTLTSAEKVDMKAIHSNIDAITQLQNQMLKKNAEHQQQIRSLLNDEQRLWFDTHKSGKKVMNRRFGPHSGKKCNTNSPNQKECSGKEKI